LWLFLKEKPRQQFYADQRISENALAVRAGAPVARFVGFALWSRTHSFVVTGWTFGAPLRMTTLLFS
jgi:hypothetical protein